MSDAPAVRVVRFDRGTLLLESWPDDDVPEGFLFDPRVRMYRARAQAYHRVILDLHRRKVPFDDQARAYVTLDREWASSRVPRHYQQEALEAWRQAGRRGCVVLPTGAGKSFVAELCVHDAGRSALIVAPTIDLVGQWYDGLRRVFGEPVGILGGGVHEVHDITVATYDSAWMHMERYGDRFGLIVFDEVHHLPGPSFAQAALQCIAPFRLGLTATLERPDDGHLRVFDLVGPICYRKEITDLAGDFLAEYRTEVRQVHLSEQERVDYLQARQTFRDFVDSEGIRFGGSGGWNNFLRATARSSAGRAAFKAWQESRRLLQAADAKLELLSELLVQHSDGRVIIFTNDNATVYAISRALLIPAITHQTELKERRAILKGFAEGDIPAIATARVLNEGVDIPAADVAIVLSGTQTVREHVQRLGRILRKVDGKQAILYELVVADSVEERQSARRRDHVAYRE